MRACVGACAFFGGCGVHFKKGVLGTSAYAGVYVTQVFFDINAHICEHTRWGVHMYSCMRSLLMSVGYDSRDMIQECETNQIIVWFKKLWDKSDSCTILEKWWPWHSVLSLDHKDIMSFSWGLYDRGWKKIVDCDHTFQQDSSDDSTWINRTYFLFNLRVPVITPVAE